jgi:hypothetical protein
VLLTRLQRQNPTAAPLSIHRFSHQSTRHLPNVFLTARQEAQVRPAETHRTAQTLALSDSDVGTVFSGSFEKAQAYRIEANNK